MKLAKRVRVLAIEHTVSANGGHAAHRPPPLRGCPRKSRASVSASDSRYLLYTCAPAGPDPLVALTDRMTGAAMEKDSCNSSYRRRCWPPDRSFCPRPGPREEARAPATWPIASCRARRSAATLTEDRVALARHQAELLRELAAFLQHPADGGAVFFIPLASFAARGCRTSRTMPAVAASAPAGGAAPVGAGGGVPMGAPGGGALCGGGAPCIGGGAPCTGGLP